MTKQMNHRNLLLLAGCLAVISPTLAGEVRALKRSYVCLTIFSVAKNGPIFTSCRTPGLSEKSPSLRAEEHRQDMVISCLHFDSTDLGLAQI